MYFGMKYSQKCDAKLDIDMLAKRMDYVRHDGSIGQIENLYVNKMKEGKVYKIRIEKHQTKIYDKGYSTNTGF